MKKTTLAICLAVMTMPIFADTLANIAFVNVNTIATELNIGPKIQEDLDKEFADLQETLKAKSNEFQKKEAKYKKDLELMSDVEKEKAERELSNLYREIIRQQNQLQEDAMARSQEEQQKFGDKLEAAINKLAKDKKFDVVMNRQAALMVSDKHDVTKEVLELMKKAN